MKFPFVMAFRGIFTILHQDIFKTIAVRGNVVFETIHDFYRTAIYFYIGIR